MAADAAAALGVKIYTVGIGEQGPLRCRRATCSAAKCYQMVPVDVDEDDAAKNRGQDGRQILPRRQRGKVPADLRGN